MSLKLSIVFLTSTRARVRGVSLNYGSRFGVRVHSESVVIVCMAKNWDSYSRQGIDLAHFVSSVGFGAAKFGTRIGVSGLVQKEIFEHFFLVLNSQDYRVHSGWSHYYRRRFYFLWGLHRH